MDIQNLQITWLGQCPTCERSEHQVETIKGTKDHLYEDDRVKCWCGQTGLIETDNMGSAWCEWDVKEITEHDKFNAYYRKKYPEYWASLPSCNYQACTHHGDLFNSWLNAKAQTVPEDFVLMPRLITEEWMAVYIDSVVTKYCKDYENLPFSVEESELPEIRESHRLPIRNAHKRLMQVIEAQEQSHDGF